MNSRKRQKNRTLKDEGPRLVGAQYATGDQWRNNSRKNEEMEPKQKQHQVVDVTGDGSKVQCCKRQYCIGTQNIRSMNQGKLEVVNQEMATVNTDMLGISKLKWTAVGEFNSQRVLSPDFPTMTREHLWAPPRHTHRDLTFLAPHERLPELPVVPREKTHNCAPTRENPQDAPVIAS